MQQQAKAIYLQSQIRTHLEVLRYRMMIRSTISIQSFFRVILAQEDFHNMLQMELQNCKKKLFKLWQRNYVGFKDRSEFTLQYLEDNMTSLVSCKRHIGSIEKMTEKEIKNNKTRLEKEGKELYKRASNYSGNIEDIYRPYP